MPADAVCSAHGCDRPAVLRLWLALEADSRTRARTQVAFCEDHGAAAEVSAPELVRLLDLARARGEC